MIKRIIAGLALGVGMAGAAQGQEIELTLNDDMAELLLANAFSQGQNRSIRYGGSFLFNEDSDRVGSLFLTINNRMAGSWQPVTIGIGPRAYLADLDRPDETLGALAVGGLVGYGIATRIPLELVLQGYLSPSITTGGDGERLTDVHARIEAEVLSGAHAYVGYRYLKVKLEDARRDERVDDAFHVGMRLRF